MAGADEQQAVRLHAGLPHCHHPPAAHASRRHVLVQICFNMAAVIEIQDNSNCQDRHDNSIGRAQSGGGEANTRVIQDTS